MKKCSFLLLIFISVQCLGQISGRILDKKTGLPISYVNIWIEKSWEGTTSDKNGIFYIEKGQVGDSLYVSHLGYQKLQIIAKNKNEIFLNSSEIELEEVIITPIKNSKHFHIKSYKNHVKIREFNFFDHYAVARYFEYNEDYAQTPFIKNISLAVFTPKNGKQIFRIYLMKPDENGKPSNKVFSEYKILEIYGDDDVNVDFTDEKLMFPKDGFFVVFDILKLKENIATNKFGHEILCPGIGMENKAQKKNTWLNYHGTWLNSIELYTKMNENRNLAINVELSN